MSRSLQILAGFSVHTLILPLVFAGCAQPPAPTTTCGCGARLAAVEAAVDDMGQALYARLRSSGNVPAGESEATRVSDGGSRLAALESAVARLEARFSEAPASTRSRSEPSTSAATSRRLDELGQAVARLQEQLSQRDADGGGLSREISDLARRIDELDRWRGRLEPVSDLSGKLSDLERRIRALER